MAAASRISSVSGLKANPHIAKGTLLQVFAELVDDFLHQYHLLACIDILDRLEDFCVVTELCARLDECLHILREAAAAIAAARIDELIADPAVTADAFADFVHICTNALTNI